MGRGRSVVGSQLLPFPGSVSQKLTAGVAIPAAPAAPIALGQVTIPGGNVDKEIVFTVQLEAADDDTVTLHLYRDGAEIDATDVYDIDVFAGETHTLTVHWHESDPGAGAVQYVARADSAAGNVTATSRRLTAKQAG